MDGSLLTVSSYGLSRRSLSLHVRALIPGGQSHSWPNQKLIISHKPCGLRLPHVNFGGTQTFSLEQTAFILTDE